MNPLPEELRQLMEEKADSEHQNADSSIGYCRECFLAGAQALYSLLIEKGVGEFDLADADKRALAYRAGLENIGHPPHSTTAAGFGFFAGAESQHSQDAAQIQALKEHHVPRWEHERQMAELRREIHTLQEQLAKGKADG